MTIGLLRIAQGRRPTTSAGARRRSSSTTDATSTWTSPSASTVRAARGRLSALRVSRSKSCFRMALSCGRAGRLTSKTRRLPARAGSPQLPGARARVQGQALHAALALRRPLLPRLRALLHGVPRVRLCRRFRNSGTESLRESGIKWMSGGATQQRDQTL